MLTIYFYTPSGNCHKRHAWATVLSAIANVPAHFSIHICPGVAGTIQVHVR